MPLELMVAFVGFAFASSITPGPNNMMLMASGMNFGFRRTAAHFWGVQIGFTAMMIAVGLGLGQVFERYPMAYTALKIAGGLYMLHLAWKIATSGPVDGEREVGTPIGFWEAAAFQWVNGKAWVMVVGAVAAYTVPSDYTASLFMITFLYIFVGAPCSIAWITLGALMRNILREPRAVRIFNVTMAVLLVASLWPIAAEFWPR
ncbi:MAG: LysE family translocator [Proteobacteria bacterium]|nr:LysE family translocator [Pseudomonadota bacterium]